MFVSCVWLCCLLRLRVWQPSQVKDYVCEVYNRQKRRERKKCMLEMVVFRSRVKKSILTQENCVYLLEVFKLKCAAIHVLIEQHNNRRERTLFTIALFLLVLRTHLFLFFFFSLQHKNLFVYLEFRLRFSQFASSLSLHNFYWLLLFLLALQNPINLSKIPNCVYDTRKLLMHQSKLNIIFKYFFRYFLAIKSIFVSINSNILYFDCMRVFTKMRSSKMDISSSKCHRQQNLHKIWYARM